MQNQNENTEVEFAIKKLYLKDLSFESPQSPQVFFTQTQVNPQVSVDVKNFTNHINDDLFESVLLINLKVDIDDKSIFLVEVEHAGLFEVKTENKGLLDWILNVNCPTILYPYVREVIDSSIVKGGFPPLVLEHIDFAGKYKQSKENVQSN